MDQPERRHHTAVVRPVGHLDHHIAVVLPAGRLDRRSRLAVLEEDIRLVDPALEVHRPKTSRVSKG